MIAAELEPNKPIAEHYGECLAKVGYGWEDIVVCTNALYGGHGLSREQARRIVFSKKRVAS